MCHVRRWRFSAPTEEVEYGHNLHLSFIADFSPVLFEPVSEMRFEQILVILKSKTKKKKSEYHSQGIQQELCE